MKVVYVTSPAFFDADLSFVNELRKIVDLTVLIDLPSFALKSTALSIESQPDKSGIYPISALAELSRYTEFLGENCLIINRPIAKRFSLETLRINAALKRFLVELKPDLIHFNNPVTQFGKEILKFPVEKVMTIHDPIPHIAEHPGNLAIRNWNMKYVKNYILLNKSQKNDFVSNYNLRDKQVHSSFLSAFNYYRDFQHKSDSSNKFKLLFFGRITPYKGIDVLVQAFEELKSAYPKLELTIAGRGSLSVSVTEGITINNNFVSVEELSKLMNNSDLVICPYIEGTQSGVIMTSFAFSKPVLATRVGGFHEMIEDEVTGFLVEPNSVAALKTKLIEILEKPEVLNQISENITSTYHTSGERSWKASVEKTHSIYKTILGRDGL